MENEWNFDIINEMEWDFGFSKALDEMEWFVIDDE